MSTPKDTLLRQLAMLQLIPRAPACINTSTLAEKLAERGFHVDARTIQRDLKDRLSLILPLLCNENERPYRWSFDAQAEYRLPSMDTPAALALHLAESQLRSLLPQSVADQLNPQFNSARQHLDGLQHNGLADWAKTVRALPNGKALLPAQINDNVWRQVTEALLNKQQLQIDYLSRTQGKQRQFTLHPAGLVSRYSISYLVATVDGYNNMRKFALHRIQSATPLEQPATPATGFDLDNYIATGEFGWLQQAVARNVTLQADIHPQIAWLLNETPLSQQQQITPLADSDWHRLQAEVPDDQETLWWIFGLNDKIRVHQPAHWVDAIRESLEKMQVMYRADYQTTGNKMS